MVCFAMFSFLIYLNIFKGGDKSAELQKVNLKIISNDICSGYFPTNRKLRNGIIASQLCLGDNDGRDTCQVRITY